MAAESKHSQGISQTSALMAAHELAAPEETLSRGKYLCRPAAAPLASKAVNSGAAGPGQLEEDPSVAPSSETQAAVFISSFKSSCGLTGENHIGYKNLSPARASWLRPCGKIKKSELKVLPEHTSDTYRAANVPD